MTWVARPQNKKPKTSRAQESWGPGPEEWEARPVSTPGRRGARGARQGQSASQGALGSPFPTTVHSLRATEGFGSLRGFLHFTWNPLFHLPAAPSAERTYFGDCQEAADTTRLCQYSIRFCSRLPPHPLPDTPSGASGRRRSRRWADEWGWGDRAQNKQVLPRVVYTAGGPDVSREAPPQSQHYLPRGSPSLQEVGVRGR